MTTLRPWPKLIQDEALGVETILLGNFDAERGGDLVLIPKPYVIPGGGKTGTTHGSAYSYDTHVPIFFHGSIFRPGRYPTEFNITHVVPTLCVAFGMNEPAGCMRKPRSETLQRPLLKE